MTIIASDVVGRGRTSIVYAIDGDRVIKTYPDGMSSDEIEAEARAATLAYDLGVPGVRCYGWRSEAGHDGIVFERLTGEALTTIAENDLTRFPQVCRVLADHHALMHRVAAPGLRDVREIAAGLLDSPALAGFSAGEKDALRGYLRSLPEGDRLLHMDYHPQNIFSHRDGYAVIDWYSACRGDAAADVAMSMLLMSEVELFPGTPAPKRALYTVSRAAMRRLYLRRYIADTGMSRERVAMWLTAARVLRLGLLDVPSERARLMARIRKSL